MILRIKIWLRELTLRWEHATAVWVIPEVVYQLIDEESFDEARELVKAASEVWGSLDPELVRANSLIAFLSEDGKGAI